ncbi:MAG: hypothetical protein KDJ36_17880 [Hyphomicrobiaceae bacterium]|nr:hypothetical protein [Hyphomicrobiaceae bacterium]
MTNDLTVHLTPEILSAIQTTATATGRTASEVAAETLAERYGALVVPNDVIADEARKRFERHFGSLDMERPIGIENTGIDADLAKQFDSRNESR